MLPVSGPLLAARGKHDAAGFNKVALCSLTRSYRDEGIIVDDGQSDSFKYVHWLFGMQEKFTRQNKNKKSHKSATKIIGTFLNGKNTAQQSKEQNEKD